VEWFVAWFVATDFVSEGAQELDNGEKISVEVTTFDEVRSLALSTDSSAMGHALPLFSRFLTLQELLDAPAFTGREIDR
jgi:hypothetical protein